MEQKEIKRINELAKKAKTEGLTEEEIKERDLLRKKYLASIRANFRATLESIEFTEGKNNKDK